MRSQARSVQNAKTRLGFATTKCAQHEYSVHLFRGCSFLIYYLQVAFCSEANFHPKKNVPLGASQRFEFCTKLWLADKLHYIQPYSSISSLTPVRNVWLAFCMGDSWNRPWSSQIRFDHSRADLLNAFYNNKSVHKHFCRAYWVPLQKSPKKFMFFVLMERPSRGKMWDRFGV